MPGQSADASMGALEARTAQAADMCDAEMMSAEAGSARQTGAASPIPISAPSTLCRPPTPSRRPPHGASRRRARWRLTRPVPGKPVRGRRRHPRPPSAGPQGQADGRRPHSGQGENEAHAPGGAGERLRPSSPMCRRSTPHFFLDMRPTLGSGACRRKKCARLPKNGRRSVPQQAVGSSSDQCKGAQKGSCLYGRPLARRRAAAALPRPPRLLRPSRRPPRPAPAAPSARMSPPQPTRAVPGVRMASRPGRFPLGLWIGFSGTDCLHLWPVSLTGGLPSSPQYAAARAWREPGQTVRCRVSSTR